MSKHYAVADFHGEYWAWEKVKNYCAPDDTIYFLGDACDRGEQGAQIMKELVEDNRVIYIEGNHEVMMLDYFYNRKANAKDLWDWNGGEKTYENLYKLYNNKQDILSFLNKLDEKMVACGYLFLNNKEIYLCHAGFTPSDKTINKYNISITEYNLIWDRNHLEDEKCNTSNAYVIFGHTPTIILGEPRENPNIVTFCDNYKIDIDLGTHWSKKTCLYDLDNMKPIYFYRGE